MLPTLLNKSPPWVCCMGLMPGGGTMPGGNVGPPDIGAPACGGLNPGGAAPGIILGPLMEKLAEAPILAFAGLFELSSELAIVHPFSFSVSAVNVT